ARIIQARMEEIFDYVVWEIRRSGYDRKLIGGIVLTGGGSLMRHIDKLVELHTGQSCRVGIPVENLAHGYHERLGSPIFATSIGLLLKGFDDIDQGKVVPRSVEQPTEEVEEEELAEALHEDEAGGKWLETIFKKTKEWFEAEPDSEF
ncbi:MAG: cell division protein FtsA, partial [Bacteroidota bacterium]